MYAWRGDLYIGLSVGNTTPPPRRINKANSEEQTIVTPYERVQLSRQRTNDTFPFPELRPNLDYTICEFGGEYRDALLRDERNDDKRNTMRGHDARAEMGDSFYMLLSACIRADHAPECHPVPDWNRRRRCNEILRSLTRAADEAARLDGETTSMDYAYEGVCRHMDEAYSNMVILATSQGWPVDALVEDACAKFERKYGLPEQAYNPEHYQPRL
jgi:hypothetical protein